MRRRVLLSLAVAALSAVGVSVLASSAPAPALPEGSVPLQVRIGWELFAPGSQAEADEEPTIDNGALLPNGNALNEHPSLAAFRDQVAAIVATEVPLDIRNAWEFRNATPAIGNTLVESEIRDALQTALGELNGARDAIAADAGLPPPPLVTLSTGKPARIEHAFYDSTERRIHRYELDLGGMPWHVSNDQGPGTAVLGLTLCWERRVD